MKQSFVGLVRLFGVLILLLNAGMILPAQGWIQTLDTTGLTVFDMAIANSQDYLLTGYETPADNQISAFLLAIDEEGNWNWKVNFHPNSRGVSIYQGSDQHLFVLTQRRDGALDIDTLRLLRFNRSDRQLETIELGTSGAGQGLTYKLLPLAEGGFAVAKVGINNAQQLILLNELGEIQQQLSLNHLKKAYDFFELPNGNFLIAGQLRNPLENAFSIIDRMGNLLSVDTLNEYDFQGSIRLHSLPEERLLAVIYDNDNLGVQLLHTPIDALAWEEGPISLAFYPERLNVLTHPSSPLLGITGISRSSNGMEVAIDIYSLAEEDILFSETLQTPLPGYEFSLVVIEAAILLADGGFLLSGQINLDIEENDLVTFITRLNSDGQVFNQLVEGRVKTNFNDCTAAVDDEGIERAKVVVTDQSNGFQRVYNTQEDGSYRFFVDTIIYDVEVVPPNDYWNVCTVVENLLVPLGDTVQLNYQLEPVVPCPFLEVDIGTAYLEPLEMARYFVRYCNSGTVVAPDAYVEIALASAMEMESSEQSYEAQGGNSYRFDLGNVAAGFCGTFSFDVLLQNSDPAQTHCVQAHIFPDSLCTVNTAWSGASVELQALCENDSLAFTIYNRGAGSMDGPLPYVVIEDIVIRREGVFDLPPGDSLVVKFPANGSTWFFRAEQEPFHPGNSHPQVAIEGCGANSLGTFSVGFISQFAENDGDPFVSIDCYSGFPDSKMGFPLGYGRDHLIDQGQRLEYILYFANPGPDTLRELTIYDTLSVQLNPVTVLPGVASHPYLFNQSGARELRWAFTDLLLPPAAQGFVKFSVEPLATLPSGTRIENQAWFSYNNGLQEPSTLSFHQIDTNFIARPVFLSTNELIINPNPGLTTQSFYIPQAWDQQLIIRDIAGRIVEKTYLEGGYFKIKNTLLPAGVYALELRENNQRISTGKLVLMR